MLHMHSHALCTQKEKHCSVVNSFCDLNILTEHAAQKTHTHTHTHYLRCNSVINVTTFVKVKVMVVTLSLSVSVGG